MDAVVNLQRIFKIVLKGVPPELYEKEEFTSLSLQEIKISESINTVNYAGKHIEEVLTSTELMLKLFFNDYESKFNVIVEYIFHQIQNIFHHVIFSRTTPAIPLDNLFNIFKLITEITIKFPCDANIKTLESFYKWNIEEIKLKLGAEHDSASLLVNELTVHLRITSIVYDVVCNSKSELQQGIHVVGQFVKCMTSNHECETFVKIACENSGVLMIQLLIDVIPNFIEITRCFTLLQLMWEEICHLYVMNTDVENSKIFPIFCYLSDLYFGLDNVQMMINIFTESTYWILIQNGLISSNAAVRKQALFLTKTSLNYIIENDVNFYCYKKEIVASQEDERHTRKIPIIYWEPGMKFDELKKLCMIIEYLEEKQMHIVQPIFSTIKSFIINMQEEKLDVSWVLMLIQKMIDHDNMKIVRQGINNLMNINLSCYQENCAVTKAVKLLVRSLNCTQIYMTDLPAFLEELKTYFENCAKHENGKIFFRILLQEICKIQWSSEALCAMTYSLHSIKSEKHWYIDEMNLVKRLLTSGTANHYACLKSGVQCQLLVAAINLIDTCSVTLEDVDHLLNCCNRKILQRKTVLWETVVKWIRKFCDVEGARRFISDALGKRNIGRMMVILFDSFADNKNFLQDAKNLLKNISVLFVDVHARPYCDKQVQDCYLSIICDIIGESCGDMEFCNIFRPYLSDIILYIKLKLESIRHIADYQLCKVFMKYLHVILKHCAQHLILSDIINKWFDGIVTNLNSKGDSNKICPVQVYVQISLVNLIMNYTSCEIHTIESYLRAEINSSLVKTTEDRVMTKDSQTLWGKMNSEFSREKWEILSKIQTSPLKVLQVSKSGFMSRCLEALDLSGHTVLLPLISVVGKALPLLLDESGLEKLVDSIWRTIMERKKNEDYLSLLERFVEAIFQLEVIRNGNTDVRQMLVNHSHRMLSENAAGPAIILVKQLQKIGFHQGGMYLFKEVLPRALIFGQMLKKEERLIRELCSIMDTSRLSPTTNDFSSSSEVRARSIQIVLTLNPLDEIHCKFCEDLFESLTILEESNSNKTRYFCDSHVHRIKQRLMQALLVLEPYITKICRLCPALRAANELSSQCRLITGDPLHRYTPRELTDTVHKSQKFQIILEYNVYQIFWFSKISKIHSKAVIKLEKLLHFSFPLYVMGPEKLWNWLSKKILIENNQASVRYLQEWLILRIIHRDPRFRIAVWTYFDEGLEKRTGSLCSLISIIYHCMKCTPGDDELADLIERAVKTFLPYCMAQHFSVRLYAQFTLEKLLETASSRCLKTITNEYAAIKKSLKQSINKGNVAKTSAKLRENFYFNVFDPIEHYTLQTIFFELPRLTGVDPEELIPEHVFIKSGVLAVESVVPLINTDHLLDKLSFVKWKLAGPKEEDFGEDEEVVKEDQGTLNFQKKNIPVKYMIPDREELLQSASLSSEKTVKDGLVVVASLIDRMPNLGGLSRTCEVFGACELVIGSLKYADDKQFRSLSVTAEKWITMTEVKPFYLADYLTQMKRNGYTVLAAEQTVNSQPLQSVKFPKKSLLLLGNEKEGIPPKLLPLMDICVEIPQIGVIRSLNVHVTGALFVWEYTKQHHLRC